jgi:uncharacterized protein
MCGFIKGIPALVVLLVLAQAVNAGPILKVLIVDGQNNHNWRATTPVLRAILEETGIFLVDVATSPERVEAARGGRTASEPAATVAVEMSGFKPEFAAYRLVLLNYNGDAWAQETQRTFVDYVKNGGGVVVVHAANNAFPGWQEYNEIIGLGGWGERDERWGPYLVWRDGKAVRDYRPGPAGSHGPRHEFQLIMRDRDHPISAGLPETWMHASDELYAALRGSAGNLTILATAYSSPEKGGTGEHEPQLMTVEYGKGRIFHTALGHDAASMKSVGFIATLQRGAEWAATGTVTQPVPGDFPTAQAVRVREPRAGPRLHEAIRRSLRYRFGMSREALTDVNELVVALLGTEEGRAMSASALVAALQADETTQEARQFFCRLLAIVGGESEVSVLASMLRDEETSDMARFALESIPGSSATRALGIALQGTAGRVKLGIINSLGIRADRDSVETLAALMRDHDSDVAATAAAALGRIGGTEASRALMSALHDGSRAPLGSIVHAALQCADGMAASGNTTSAARVYEAIYQRPELPVSWGVAAWLGMIRVRDDAAGAALALHSDQKEVALAAVRLVRELKGDQAVAAFSAELPRLAPEMQVLVLRALGDHGNQAALGAAKSAAGSEQTEVRVAALEAIGKLGGEGEAGMLLQAAASRTGAERETARGALAVLRGPGVDETILRTLKSLDSADRDGRREMIRGLALRFATSAVDALLGLTQDKDSSIRVETIRALGELAPPDRLPEMIDLLVSALPSDRRDAGNAVTSVIQRAADPKPYVEAVLTAMDGTSDPAARGSLLSVLGRIGGPAALEAVRGGLASGDEQVRDAAIRALADWPSAEPLEDLLSLAKDADVFVHRVLSLRGYVRLIGVARNLSDEERVRRYAEAMAMAPGEDEKRQILGSTAIAEVHTLEALNFALPFLQDQNLSREAADAAIRIASYICDMHKKETDAAMKEIAALFPDDSWIQNQTGRVMSDEGVEFARSRRGRQNRATRERVFSEQQRPSPNPQEQAAPAGRR